MFESSLFESSSQVRSRSGRYMWATSLFNVAAVAAMAVVPLLYPEALPRSLMTATLVAPPPPPPPAPPRPAVNTVRSTPAAAANPFTAPSRMPAHVVVAHDDPPALAPGVIGAGPMSASSAGPAGAMGYDTPAPLARVTPSKPAVPAHVSSGVVAGNKLSGSTPVYPAIARATHISGTVVLHAVISKAGTIESLSVLSGPEMLRSSAVNAVQDWRYKPYLLNGEPTEVDTTITVNFSFGG